MPDAGRGSATYPVATIARLLLLTERRVQQLAAEGVLPKGERGRYGLVACVQGYVRYLKDRAVVGDAAGEGGPAADDKARKLRAEVGLAELELARARGEVVDRAAVEAGLAAMDGALKDRLLMVPLSAAPDALEAAGRAGAPGIEAVYAAAITAALADFASAEIVERAAAA